MTEINRYIPKGYVKVETPAHLDIEVYASPDSPYAIGYMGRSKKAVFHYRYQSMENMQKYIAKFIESAEARAAYKAEQKAKKKAAREQGHNIEVGTIFVSSWGWEQTNVDFYQVVGVTKNSVKLRRIASEEVRATGHMSADVVALKDHFISDEVITKRVNEHKAVKFNSFTHAHVWDGRPKHRSWYA